MSDDLAKRLTDALERAGKSAREVSMAVTGTPDTVRNILRGNTRDPKTTVIQGIARELDTTPEFLLHGEAGVTPINQARPQTTRFAPVDIPPPFLGEMPRDVPLYGTAAGSHARGAFQLFDGVVDYVRRPPPFANNRKVYALYVEGDSMLPQYAPGDLIFVNPGRPPRFGDAVVAQMKLGEHEPVEATVGIFHARTADKIVLGKHNPKSEIDLNRSYVLELHRIVTQNELYGV